MHQHTCPLLLPAWAHLQVSLRREGRRICRARTYLCQALGQLPGIQRLKTDCAFEALASCVHPTKSVIASVTTPSGPSHLCVPIRLCSCSPALSMHLSMRLPHLAVHRCLLVNIGSTGHQPLPLEPAAPHARSPENGETWGPSSLDCPTAVSLCKSPILKFC